MSNLSQLLTFPNVQVKDQTIDLQAIFHGNKGNISNDKKQCIFLSINKHGMKVASNHDGVWVNGFFLSFYELGLIENADLRSGKLMPKKIYQNPNIDISPRNYANLMGWDFMKIQNGYGTIDVNFLVSVIATEQQRSKILSASKNEMVIQGENGTTLKINDVIFPSHQVWAASNNGKAIFYGKVDSKRRQIEKVSFPIFVFSRFLFVLSFSGFLLFFFWKFR